MDEKSLIRLGKRSISKPGYLGCRSQACDAGTLSQVCSGAHDKILYTYRFLTPYGIRIRWHLVIVWVGMLPIRGNTILLSALLPVYDDMMNV